MADKYQNRYEFVDWMLSEVKKIPVKDVIEQYVPLRQKGNYWLGLCPFHADHTEGSFVITPHLNRWKCFAEDHVGGVGPISFVVAYENLSRDEAHQMRWLEAAFLLALRYGIISEEEYKKYSRKRWDDHIVRKIERRIEAPAERERKVAPPEVCAAVYNAIPHVCALSEAHKRHLTKERMLKESDLSDYFTFPTRRTDLAGKCFRYIAETYADRRWGKKLTQLDDSEKEIVEKKMAPVRDNMEYVPGFFKNQSGRVDFTSYRGIGFVVRDEKERPVGVHVRQDKGTPRYLWFSSAFAQSKEDLEGGASSGSPAGFLPAKNCDKVPALCITEGRFKAEKISANGCDVIYLAGVSSWGSGGVLKMLQRAAGDRKKVFLAFDADMLGNNAVYRNLKGLALELQKNGFFPKVLLWAKEHGKGFDDLVINVGSRYKNYLTSMTFDEFDEVYQRTLSETLTLYQVKDIKDVKAEESTAFVAELQELMEEELGLK